MAGEQSIKWALARGDARGRRRGPRFGGRGADISTKRGPIAIE